MSERRKWTFYLGGLLVLVLASGCSALDEGTLAQLVVVVNGEIGDFEYELSPIVPGTGNESRVEIELKNAGSKAFQVTRVEIQEQNDDGTPKNQYVTIDWEGRDVTILLPWEIRPNDPNTHLSFKVVYKPDTIDANASTVVIHTTDPEHPVTKVVFTQKTCTPIIEVQPPKDTYFNATPSNPETKLFQIINNGTCAGKVEDIQFSKPTSVFTVQRSWPNGTSVEPALEGGEPLQFSVTFKPKGTSSNE